MLAAVPSDSAILMTALRAPPAEAFVDQTVVTLHLPRSGVERIAMRLWQGLEKAPDGYVVRLADGPYIGSVFYASRETYAAFHTCNTWTALVLHDGGLPINTHVLFAGQVMEQVSRFRNCRRASRGDQQGGCEPSGHTTLVTGGTTTVVFDGGGGLLLLKLRQPPSNSGSSRDNRRMGKRPHRQNRWTFNTTCIPVVQGCAGLVPGQSVEW